MNTRVVAKGQTTLSHELGHGFGLPHTFAGISEVTACSACYESTASDLVGDFCADTPPVIKNWDCISPLPATGSNVDTCGSRTSWNPNPYTNIMSYGTCRTSFTTCQQRRARCYLANELQWLIPDTSNTTTPAPTGTNTTTPTTTTPGTTTPGTTPGTTTGTTPKPSSAISFGISFLLIALISIIY